MGNGHKLPRSLKEIILLVAMFSSHAHGQGESLIFWWGTDQGAVLTSTAELEIKASNLTLKCEVIANRGILNQMGWTRNPTVIEEDNSACATSSQVTRVKRGLRLFDLAPAWIKETVADGTCIVVKVAFEDRYADGGPKRLLSSLFIRYLLS